jgi:hypothetical protein
VFKVVDAAKMKHECKCRQPSHKFLASYIFKRTSKTISFLFLSAEILSEAQNEMQLQLASLLQQWHYGISDLLLGNDIHLITNQILLSTMIFFL